jgi:hypothetical protein
MIMAAQAVVAPFLETVQEFPPPLKARPGYLLHLSQETVISFAGRQ